VVLDVNCLKVKDGVWMWNEAHQVVLVFSNSWCTCSKCLFFLVDFLFLLRSFADSIVFVESLTTYTPLASNLVFLIEFLQVVVQLLLFNLDWCASTRSSQLLGCTRMKVMMCSASVDAEVFLMSEFDVSNSFSQRIFYGLIKDIHARVSLFLWSKKVVIPMSSSMPVWLLDICNNLFLELLWGWRLKMIINIKYLHLSHTSGDCLDWERQRGSS
jgi:hypothetical protein